MRMLSSHDIVKVGEEGRNFGDRDSFFDHIEVSRLQIAAIIISSVRLSR